MLDGRNEVIQNPQVVLHPISGHHEDLAPVVAHPQAA
jgi:hypothetical protein